MRGAVGSVVVQSKDARRAAGELADLTVDAQGNRRRRAITPADRECAARQPKSERVTAVPDAHVEAPTAGSVILAGVLLKMGTYGLLRFALPLFPEAMGLFSPYILVLSTIGIVYGALVAFAQGDIKKLVAYSSAS